VLCGRGVGGWLVGWLSACAGLGKEDVRDWVFVVMGCESGSGRGGWFGTLVVVEVRGCWMVVQNVGRERL